MANKFLSNINLTAGLEADGQAGTSGQVLSSTGTGVSWINPDTISSESAEHVQVLVKNTSGATIAKGTPVYVTGETGNSGKIEIAPADASDSAKMPALGLLLTALNDNGEGYCVSGGLLEGLATATIDGTSSTANDTVYVKAGGGLTLTKPSGADNLIQNVAKVARVHASNGSFIVSSILRTNDVPNLTTGKIWVGDGNTVESTVVHLDEANGRMGIGTASPGVNLEIHGTVNTDDCKIYLKENSLYGSYFKYDGVLNRGYIGGVTGTTSENSVMSWSRSGTDLSLVTSGSVALKIDSSRNVGIGTTSPTAKLDVRKDTPYGLYAPGNPQLNLTNTNTEGTAGFLTLSAYYNNTNNTYYKAGGIGGGKETATGNQEWGGYLSFFTTSDGTAGAASGMFEHMRITADGNVGIGTTDPQAKLHINRTTLGEYFRGGSGGLRELRFSTYNTASDHAGHKIDASSGNGEITLATGGSARVTVDNTGNVGIGTTSPSAKLDVDGNVKIKDVLLSNQENTNVDTGAEVVAQVAHATYTAAFFDFVVKKGTNVRSGTVYACHDGDTTPLVEFTETSTNDLGDTSDVTLSVDISGANMRLLATVTSDDWSVKSLIRAI